MAAASVNQNIGFIKFPRMLLKHPVFSSLKANAKVLYSLMLHRLQLSKEHSEDYTDADGQLYICYTVEQIMEDICCARATAVSLMRQLRDADLIRTKRRGQGKSSLIYVNDLQQPTTLQPSKKEKPELVPVPEEQQEEKPELVPVLEEQQEEKPELVPVLEASRSKDSLCLDVKEWGCEVKGNGSTGEQKTENSVKKCTKHSKKQQNRAVKQLFLSCKKWIPFTSRSKDSLLLEVQKLNSIKIDLRKNDLKNPSFLQVSEDGRKGRVTQIIHTAMSWFLTRQKE